MCEPVSITMGVLAVGGAVASIAGQNQQRQMAKGFENQKKNAQDDLIMENRKRATHDYLRQVRLEQSQETQENQALAETSQDIRRDTATAKATGIASAAERGVGGNSVEMLISDYEFQQGQEIGRLRMNQEQKDAQHRENIGGFQDQFDQRVTAVQPYVPRAQAPVDYFGPIFQAGSSIAGQNAGRMAAPASTTPPAK